MLKSGTKYRDISGNRFFVPPLVFSLHDIKSPCFDFYRPSARFPQHRRKKRKEMDEGIPESNQHKQSKSRIQNNSWRNQILVVVLYVPQLVCSICLHCTLSYLFLYLPIFSFSSCQMLTLLSCLIAVWIWLSSTPAPHCILSAARG